MKTVTKKEIANKIAITAGMTQKEVLQIINMFLDEIKDIFRKKERIELRGFGIFYPYFKKTRKYVVPITGEKRKMPGRWTLKFKISRQLLIFNKSK